MPDQVGAYSAYTSGVADPNALYVIIIGGNDVRDAALSKLGEPAEDNAIAAGVAAEKVAIQTLSSEGAKNFLIVNVPNVGLIPEFTQENPTLASTATQLSEDYNTLLAQDLGQLDETLPAGTNLHEFDLLAYNASLLKKADMPASPIRPTPASPTRPRPRTRPPDAAWTAPILRATSTGTTFILPRGCRRCGPPASSRRFLSRPPGLCCSSASPVSLSPLIAKRGS